MTTPAREQRPSGSAQPDEIAKLSQELLHGNPRRAFRLGLLLGVLLAVATGLLIAQNGQSVRMNWLVWDFGAPLWLFLFLSALSGAVLVQLGVFVWRRGRKHAAERKEATGRLQSLLATSSPRKKEAPPAGSKPAGSKPADSKPEDSKPGTAAPGGAGLTGTRPATTPASPPAAGRAAEDDGKPTPSGSGGRP